MLKQTRHIKLDKFNFNFKLVVIISLAFMFNVKGISQIYSVDSIKNSFTRYQETTFTERILLHSNKSFFVCGETIWYKIYLVEANTNQLVNTSKVVYVEIMNEEGKSILQSKIEMTDGTGYGSLFIPFSMQSGNYSIRAYTHWMKNFKPEFFFSKPIAIVNTLKKLPVLISEKDSLDLQFFPEGGNLINGIENNMAFMVKDNQGKGIVGDGVILNEQKDTVAYFKTAKFGMGEFSFTPRKNHAYVAKFFANNSIVISKEITAALNSGMALQLKKIDKEKINISITKDGLPDRSCFLFIHAKGKIISTKWQQFDHDLAQFSIDESLMPEGVSHFTIFDELLKPICERLYFKQPKNLLKINVTTDSSNYATRAPIKINLSSEKQLQANEAMNCSLSVFRIDELQQADYEYIEEYLWLSSELKGAIETPGYYFNANNDSAAIAADLLMQTQGWSRFTWDEVLTSTKPMFKFLPEYEGQIIEATISSGRPAKPVANVPVSLSIPGNPFIFKNAQSNNSGVLKFAADRWYGSNDIILQPTDSGGLKYQFDVHQPFSESISPTTYTGKLITKTFEKELRFHSVNAQVMNTFLNDSLLKASTPDTNYFYGKNARKYLLDNYTRFVTLEEVLREYVVEVKVRKLKDNFSFRVLNQPFQSYFETAPLVLLDGVPMQNINALMEYDPLKIKQLDVIPGNYFYGKNVYEGVMSFTTYTGKLEGFTLNPNAVVIEYEGLQLKREFYAPKYLTAENTNSRTPDFREALLWKPEIKAKLNQIETIEFYTGDLTGKFIVIAQGIGSSGKAGHAISYFNVKK